MQGTGEEHTLSINTQAWVWVYDWSRETCKEILEHRANQERLYRECMAMPEGERGSYPRLKELADWEGPMDSRITYYDRRHMAGVKEEYWGEFAAWCATKGHKPTKGEKLYHSMTMWSSDRLE